MGNVRLSVASYILVIIGGLIVSFAPGLWKLGGLVLVIASFVVILLALSAPRFRR